MDMPLASRRRLSLVLALCAFVTLLTSCSKPAYWIEGLSLPPGSTVDSQVETSTPQDVPGISLPMMGEFDQALTVSFDNLAGWNAVALHVDRCLQDQGYSEGLTSAGNLLSSMPVAGGRASGMDDYMRMYTKQGAQYMVVLYSIKDMLRETGAPLGSAPASGGFILQVMKFKRN